MATLKSSSREVRASRRVACALAVWSLLMLSVRLFAATRVGFGDSEALYASWAMFPQPAYLDHPGLVGELMRLIGSGLAPRPVEVHLVTSVIATALPWLVALVARVAGASSRRALIAGAVFAVVPETAVGLFALTPDLPLAALWLGTLAFAHVGLSATPTSLRATLGFLAAGVAAGAASASKVSGLALGLALLVTYAAPSARPHARTPWPWLGLLAGALVFLPVVHWEWREGWPMLTHRLVATQTEAGMSLRNVAQTVGGQLAYVSPGFLWLAYVAARDQQREGARTAANAWLYRAVWVPLALLLPLSLWSRVAEPHWLAPPLLSLLVVWAVSPVDSERPRAPMVLASFGLATAMTLTAHAWVLVPSASGLAPEASDRRWDLATELYGWPEAISAATTFAEVGSMAREGADPVETVFLGPHWTICAQLRSALPPEIPVGCLGDRPSDFDRWLPRSVWRRARSLVLVSDDRFPVDPSLLLPERAVVRDETLQLASGRARGRLFRFLQLERRGLAAQRAWTVVRVRSRTTGHLSSRDFPATVSVAPGCSEGLGRLRLGP